MSKSEDFEIGDKIQFIDSMKPLVIKDAVVTGHDIEDRVLARYEYHDGIFAEGASIHVNRILPKQIERVS